MSTVLSLRLQESQVRALERAARRLGRTPSQTAALMLDEALRQAEHPFIEFRNSSVGRQAYIQGTRLAVWQVAATAEDYGGDAAHTAEHLGVRTEQASAALRYASTYPQQIRTALDDYALAGDTLESMLPSVERRAISAPPA